MTKTLLEWAGSVSCIRRLTHKTLYAAVPDRGRFGKGRIGLAVTTAIIGLASIAAAMMIPGTNAQAQCTEQGPLQNFTGPGISACPCFVPGEEAGAVFDLPPSEYPIEILKIGIGWGSQYGATHNRSSRRSTSIRPACRIRARRFLRSSVR